MSIVIVDDDETNLLMIERILYDGGYGRILKASSADELFRLMETAVADGTEISIDLIVMDITMPEVDGIAATKRMQLDERFKDIPVIIVTAIGDSNKLAEALDAGASDYVMQPINKIELFARIRSALKLKFEKDRHKERDKRIQFELDLAKRIQQNVLDEPINDRNISIQAICRPSFELAGDFYAWHPLDNHRYGVILLDMMGHGISSSLICMYISSILQDTIKKYLDPVQVVKELNRYMNQLEMTDGWSNYYFTAIYLLLDTKRKTIEYVNAGHPPGVVIIDDQVGLLTEGCCAIGFFENIEIHKGILRYKDQFKLFLYTDGLIDCSSQAIGEGMDKLIAELSKCSDLDFPALVQRFIADDKVKDQQDDICLVMISSK
jgi:sigma-B regulation protein RsbU (phosphoserine phosphatase)